MRTAPEGLHVYSWIKDAAGQYTEANQAYLYFLGLASERQLSGCCDGDFFPVDLSRQYVQEDRQVRVSGRAMTHQVELVASSQGVIKWYVCTKWPITRRHGKVIATAGRMCPFDQAPSVFWSCTDLWASLRQVLREYSENLSAMHLAKLAHLSPSQFTRRFNQVFQMTPHQFLLRIRIQAASQMLTHSELPIAQIALRTGFYDQSHFIRHFWRHMHISPKIYRRQFRRGDDWGCLAFLQPEGKDEGRRLT